MLTSIVAVIQGTKPDLEFIVNSLFPTATGRYWYATAYFILVLLSPYLNLLVSKADKKTFRQVTFTLGGLFLLIPTFLYYGPNGSYSTNWVIMICYYVILQYIRKYQLLDRIRTQCLILVACLDFVLMMVLNYTASLFVGKSMPFGYFMPFSRGCCVLMLVFAISTFELFHRWNFQSEWINKIAKFVFPMYILDRLIRSIIEYFIPVPDLVQEGLWRYLCMVGYVLIVMLTAVIIEVIRKKVFCHVEDKLFQSIHTVVKSIYVERKGVLDD